MSCFATSSPKLLHDRLGHPSLAKLKIMVPSLKQLQKLECESCQLDKHVRSSFARQTEKKCNSVFSTIHSMPASSPDSCPLPSASHTMDPSSTSHPSEPSSDWPKGIQSTRNSHPIYNFELSLHISYIFLLRLFLVFYYYS